MSTVIHHGAFAMESPYEVRRIYYGSSDCEDECQGFLEVLHVKNPPPGRRPYVVHYQMHFPADKVRGDKPMLVRLEICCRTLEIAQAVRRELGEKFMNFQALMRSNRICGEEVHRLSDDQPSWVFQK